MQTGRYAFRRGFNQWIDNQCDSHGYQDNESSFNLFKMFMHAWIETTGQRFYIMPGYMTKSGESVTINF